MTSKLPPERIPAIDAYLDAANPDFRPMLAALRDAVHRACPQAEEAIKWGMPTFLYRGKILCGMAAFKQHMSFGYWQHAEVLGEAASGERTGMGSYGKMRTAADIPKPALLKSHIKRAMQLIDEVVAGTAPAKPKPARTAKPEAVASPAFAAALRANAAARKHFDAFPPGQRREYILWINEAKRDDTRERRIAQAIEWLGEGKRRNWKYENC